MYNYEEQKAEIFKEENQKQFLAIRDRVNALLREAGACRMEEIVKNQCGSSWRHIACVDRLVELGELTEVTPKNTMGQYRTFIRR